jgi:cytochrome c-type biogenesis protein CcmH/NrfG
LPISERFSKKDTQVSPRTNHFLLNEVDYVENVKSDITIDPKEFYRGVDLGWSPIIQNMDVRRGLCDSIITDHILDEGNSDTFKLILIKAHAGAGKKTLLRRIAWDSAHIYKQICLYLKRYAPIDAAAITEISNALNERLFLFIEDIHNKSHDIIKLAESLLALKKKVTIIGTARTNEWNINCEELSRYVTMEYLLRYLSVKDIESLLFLLERHGALGTLGRLTKDEQKKALSERAGRQLLVALHEATLGKSFVEIIRDEFTNIKPVEAQKVYLSICLMNRFGIPVRAGIISRIYGIGFEQFREKFFRPLELIVNAHLNPTIGDYEYTARHPHIAEILFEEILSKQEDRYNEYLLCLNSINISYESDRKVFFKLIRANDLMQNFSDNSMIGDIYQKATAISPDDVEVLHQQAIYEMKHDGGNLQKANSLLEQAYHLSPANSAIIHSIAEFKLHLAEKKSRSDLEFEKYINESMQICRDNARHLDAHGVSTMIKANILKIQRLLQKEISGADDAELTSVIKEIETHMEEALQKYPGESVISELEAKLAKLLSDSERVKKALHRSFDINPRNYQSAIRLARCYLEENNIVSAKDVVQKALEVSSNRKELHYMYAKLLLIENEKDNTLLEYHLRRSYSPKDKNYDAQMLHARQLFIMKEYDESNGIFNILRYSKVAYEIKVKPLYPIGYMFHGEIKRIEANYCFIKTEGIPGTVFCHQDKVSIGFWDKIYHGLRVKYKIAFNMSGPIAVELEIA